MTENKILIFMVLDFAFLFTGCIIDNLILKMMGGNLMMIFAIYIVLSKK